LDELFFSLDGLLLDLLSDFLLSDFDELPLFFGLVRQCALTFTPSLRVKLSTQEQPLLALQDELESPLHWLAAVAGLASSRLVAAIISTEIARVSLLIILKSLLNFLCCTLLVRCHLNREPPPHTNLTGSPTNRP
jgi:hypothetical protein